MKPRDFSELAAHVRNELEIGDVVEALLEVGDRKVGLLFVPLDLARVDASADRILPELGVGADWALVWNTTTNRGTPFRLLELGEHDRIEWQQVAEDLDLFSDDAKVVTAFLCDVGRVPHGVSNLDELLTAVPA